MDDRELLELAAKAAGEEFIDDMTAAFRCNPKRWNPLTDDGDALRLAVKLDMNIIHGWNIFPENTALATIHAQTNEVNVFEAKENDLCAATRRAIVRAAAEIGKKQNEMR